MAHTVPRSKQATGVRQAGLVEAAVRLAAQRSPADITTGDLAQAVGISQGAVFRHFPSKEAIWLAVLDWSSTTLMDRVDAAARTALAEAPSAHPLQALQAVFAAHVEFIVDHPGVPRLVFQELQHADDTALKTAVRALMQRYRSLVMELLQAAQDRALLAPDTDLPAAAVLFLGAVQGLIMQSLVTGQLQAMALQAPGVFSVYLRGITCRMSP